MENSRQTGILYLIPTPLGASDLSAVIPEQVRRIAASLDTFIVEHPKTARHFLKQITTATPLQDIHMFTLDEHTRPAELQAMLQPVFSGKNIGLISEAGCPAVADPGANLVRLAHHKNIRVVPLAGPSSIMLALMASGMNGQRFVFHGYLPVEKSSRIQKIAEIEKASLARDETQIFIEAPYRNNQLLGDMLETCNPVTQLCIACEVTLETETVHTQSIAEWKKTPPDLHKKPTVFLLYSPAPKKR